MPWPWVTGAWGRARRRDGEAKRVVSRGSWRSRLAHLRTDSTGAAFDREIDGALYLSWRKKKRVGSAVCCNGGGWKLCGAQRRDSARFIGSKGGSHGRKISAVHCARRPPHRASTASTLGRTTRPMVKHPSSVDCGSSTSDGMARAEAERCAEHPAARGHGTGVRCSAAHGTGEGHA